MPRPFPGMDPYLESDRFWPEFHHQMVTCLHQVLLPGLADRYELGIRTRHYVLEQPTPTAPVDEEYIEITQEGENRLVTLVELVSLANKTTASGRQAYLETRQEGRAAGASLVEIDLVLQGRPTLEYSREGLPDWDYAVTVTRATQPDRYEIYTATLQKPLPRFRLPMARDDRDTVVDLQKVLERCYDQADFAAKIDYRRPPTVPLKDAHRRLLAEWLQWPNTPPDTVLPHEEIARVAYSIWQEQGCPEGRAAEHWRLAIERLNHGGRY